MAEQVNPNALGAPAEGFGQTVSFAFDPRGDVPQQQPVTSQPRGMSVSGGSQARAQDPNNAYVNIGEDKTSALLMQVGADILGKKLEEERNVKFVEGMQRAMNGEAITEVQKSVPWYAKIFGDTPAIEGARAYTAASKVNETIAQQTADMPRLQELDSAAAAKHFSGIINQSMTGDAGTDNVIMKGMVEQLPALMKAQAKAHYGWGQKKAMNALGQNMMTGAAALQQYGEMYAEDKVSEADMKVRADGYLRSILPPAMIDEENYVKTLVGNVRTMAAQGQFHAIDIIKKAGAFAAMTPEQVNSVEGVIMSAATKARDNYAFKYAGVIAEIKSDAAHPPEGATPQAISDRIDGMNTKYQKLTGSPVGLFSSDQKADMINGTFNAIKSELVRADHMAAVAASKASTEAEKAMAAAQIDATVEGFVSTGNITAAKMVKGITDDMIDLKVVTMYKKNPEAGAAMLANLWFKDNYISKPLQNELLTPLKVSEGQGTPTDGWFRSVDKFNQLKQSPGGLAYAAAYYGDYAKKLERASRMLGDRVFENPDSARIFEATFGGTWAQKPDTLNEKERKVAVKAVTDLNSNAIIRKFTGKTKLREDAIAIISDVAQANIEDWRGTDMSDTEAVAQGVASAITSSRLELLGGFAIKNSDVQPNGKKPKSLRELASTATNFVPVGREDDYFEGFMHSALKIPTSGSVRINRLGESNGVERFRVDHLDNGEAKAYVFTSATWQDFAAKYTAYDTKGGPRPIPAPFISGPDVWLYDGTTPVEKARKAALEAEAQSKRDKPFRK